MLVAPAATAGGQIYASANGTVASQYAYAAYGDQTLGQNDRTSTLRFAGQYFIAELGLYYMRARFSDPGAGRFLTPDPLDPGPTAPTTYNPYLYAADNPTRFTDPTGTQEISDVLVCVSIVSTLASVVLGHYPQPIVWIAHALGLPRDLLPTVTGLDVLIKGEFWGSLSAGVLLVGEYGQVQNGLEVALEIGVAFGGHLPGEAGHASVSTGLTYGKGELPDKPEIKDLAPFIFLGGTIATALAKGVIQDQWTHETVGVKLEFVSSGPLEFSAFFSEAHAPNELPLFSPLWG